MKSIIVTMSLSEKVLDSYLIRNFGGTAFPSSDSKIVGFNENSVTGVWNIPLLRDFCQATVSAKTSLKIKKVKVVES